MKFKIEKNLNCTKQDAGKVSIKSFYDAVEEIEFLTYEIRDLIKSGVPKDEIAVLFRTNRIGKEIEKEFNRNRIPCHISKSKDFFEREEVRDILSFLRLKANPNSLIDFHRTLTLIPGVGNSTIRKFEIMADDNNITLTESLKFADKLISGATPEKIAKLNALKEALQNENPDSDPLQLFLKHFNYESYLTRKYLNEDSKLNDKFENISILSELFNDFFEDFSNSQYKTEADYDADDDEPENQDNDNELNSDKSTVADLGLHYQNKSISDDEPISADLLEEADSAKNTKAGINSFLDSLIELEKRDKTNRNKVTLSTIHSAKGLEWSHVFLVSCNEKTLPFYRGNSELTSTKRDSELRLFYVALSRAKNSLTITHSDYNQWGSELAPSQFLDILEIEEDESMKDNGWDKVRMIEI